MTKAKNLADFSPGAVDISSINVTKNPISPNRFSPYVDSEITIFGTFPSSTSQPTIVFSFSGGTFSVPSQRISSYDVDKIVLTTGVRVFPAKEFTSVTVTFGSESGTSNIKLISSAAPYYLDYRQVVTIPAMSTPGSSGSVTYSVLSGSLPPNFTLNSDGTIYGWYQEAYTNADSIRYTAVIRATDSTAKTWEETVEVNIRIPFLYRQVITTGYVAGGYKDSVPWAEVNKILHSNDTATNLGDLLQNTHNYTSGACNRDRGFIWGGGAMNPGNYTYTSVFNMRNDTTYSKTSAMDTPVTVGDAGTVQKEHTKAWIANGLGSSVVLRYDLVTEQASTTFALSHLQNDGTGAGGVFSETDGWFWADGSAMKLNFATETQTNPGVRVGAHGQQKGMPSKVGYGWAGNEGSYNGGYQLRKFNTATETNETIVPKPIGNSGEENFTMGQHEQYMLGMYDSGQNNRAWKFSYTTDVGYEGGASMQPKGKPGRSSGHGYWRD